MTRPKCKIEYYKSIWVLSIVVEVGEFCIPGVLILVEASPTACFRTEMPILELEEVDETAVEDEVYDGDKVDWFEEEGVE